MAAIVTSLRISGQIMCNFELESNALHLTPFILRYAKLDKALMRQLAIPLSNKDAKWLVMMKQLSSI